MSPRPADGVGTQHLGTMVSAYVDRVLPPPLQHACDRHLVTCAVCREAAAAERRLLGSLREARMPGPPSRLQASLLDLAAQAPAPVGPAPLGLVRRDAPAMHRSPVRAAMLAGLAAGASAAAAWSIGVATPAAAPVPPVAPTPSWGAPAPSTPFARTVAVLRPGLGRSQQVPQTSVTVRRAHWAESLHD